MKSKRRVILWMLSHNKYGGWCTFTAHLVRALELQGLDHSIYKVTHKGQRSTRKFGWGLTYENRAKPKVVNLGEDKDCATSYWLFRRTSTRKP